MITAQQAQELLDKATPGPWRMGRRDLDCEDSITQDIPTRNIPLLLAAPDLAATVIALTERLVSLDLLLTSYELMGVPKEGPLSRLIADIRHTILGGDPS
jgi:hypothetical protein